MAASGRDIVRYEIQEKKAVALNPELSTWVLGGGGFGFGGLGFRVSGFFWGEGGFLVHPRIQD